MTNTFALTDYDVFQEEEYDNFGGRRRRRKKRRRTRKLMKRRRSSKRKLSRPPLGRPPIRVRPKIVRGRPMKLPPIKVGRAPVIVPRRKPRPIVTAIKVKKAPIVKAKTPISHLIRKSNPKLIKKQLSVTSQTEVKDIKAAQVEASKKAMESDGKTSKLVKVVAIVGLVGVTGFGIYKFIQNKKISNGHISTSK
ncbi:hypothetical protein [uncultured Winogradskyella sp.]|uniref:hypothetical protein n=1 Tax=uncultured Winogradskyella sp. TaxID=395353 RepID=UPI0030D79AE8|tara:strand:+ start:12028 stop:12609 length:582 start_codon:yes stop_codon:yes gene_type:complete